jgi:arginase family enzyme
MLAVVFPFDLFGSAGTGAGAQLLGDALREMLADARRETQPARSHAYRGAVRVRDVSFDSMSTHFAWRAKGHDIVRDARNDSKRLLWLAGNHLGVLPVLEQLDSDTLVLQFDAHLDIYNLADCTKELSHGNFLLHAERPLPPIVNIGSRDLFLPSDHAHRHFRDVFAAESLVCDADGTLRRLTELAKKAKRIWIDIDCDVFDPAYVPAVQHPQPMGLAPALVLRILSGLRFERVVGVSISEFDPGRDRHDQSLQTLVWLIEWILLRWSKA